jgi:prepilin-type N-terminal cleavage/methylation domain-containing protein
MLWETKLGFFIALMEPMLMVLTSVVKRRCSLRRPLGAIEFHEGAMRLTPRQAFTIVELMVTVAVFGIVSSLVIRGTYTFIQEQHLRQAANELVSHLLIARSRALREANDSDKACELRLDAATTRVEATDQAANICNDAPAIPALDLLAASGAAALTITASEGSSPYYITFTRMGTVASSNLSDNTRITLPRIFYLSNSPATQVQRCVMVDLNSLRIGWRNSPATALCTYNGN